MKKFSLDTITNVFKKLSKKKLQAERQLFTPARDWNIIFGVHVLLFLGLVVFGVYTFYTSNSGIDIALETEVVELESVDVEELDGALSFFEEKKETFDTLIEAPSRMADPF